MNLVTLLQKLANTVHHNANTSELIADQTPQVQQAFLTNNGAQLKSLLGDTTNLADRDKVTQF